jgi:hypothetical protein
MARGDPRVHLVMNAVLSVVYAAVVVWGLGFIDLVAFTVRNVAVAAVVIFALTYLVVLR